MTESQKGYDDRRIRKRGTAQSENGGLQVDPEKEVIPIRGDPPFTTDRRALCVADERRPAPLGRVRLSVVPRLRIKAPRKQNDANERKQEVEMSQRGRDRRKGVR